MILSLIFFIVSCEKENEIEYTELGTEFFISGDYTSLDSEVTFAIENQQKNLSQIVVTALGGVQNDEDETEFPPPVPDLGSITLTAGEGSLTVSDTDLGMTIIDWTADFQFDASYNGKAIQRFYNLAVADPISVEDPGVTIRNDTVYYFTFAIEPASATVETVTVQTKVGALADYSPPLAGPFNAVDSIAITGTDYSFGDTLFVNVIGTVGSKTAETETGLAIGALSVSNMESFELDATPDQAFDFIAADFVASSAGESADIEFTGSYGTNGLIVGFVSNQNAEFVPGTSADYEAADSLTLINKDFTGSITFDDNVSEGNVYYFRTKRTGGDWFIGIMKIATLDKPQGILEDSYMEIEYKH